MQTNERRDLPDTLAKIFSVIFHPVFIPLYGLAIIFSAPTLFGYLPFNVKRLLFLIIIVNNVFVPISLLPFLYHRSIISSWTINDRKERIIPMILITLLYAATSYIIFKFPIPVFLKSFIYSAFFISLIVTIINLWWKISIHSVGAGVLIAIVFMLSFKMYTPLVWYFVSAIIIAGLILSSRLRLNYHNPRQVWLGLLTGFAGLTLFMMLFQ